MRMSFQEPSQRQDRVDTRVEPTLGVYTPIANAGTELDSLPVANDAVAAHPAYYIEDRSRERERASRSAAMLIFDAGARQEPDVQECRRACSCVVMYVKLKAGIGVEARRLLREQLLSVVKPLHYTTVCFDFEAGEWDQVIYFPLEERSGEVDWTLSPMILQWLEQFYRLADGNRDSGTLWKQYGELVERSRVEVAVATF